MVSDQQLHLRRRGAPAVRRQRQVRQRIAPVRHLGARPVHPLAVGQLGLLGPAAEGADGRRRADPATPTFRLAGLTAAQPRGRTRIRRARPGSARQPRDVSADAALDRTPMLSRSLLLAGCSTRQAAQPAPGRRRPRAAGARRGLLHDRLGRAREQRAGRAGRCGRPTRRCCTTGPAAFYVARARQVPGSTPVRDVLQGLMGLADEPIAGGRHKVFGHPELAVIPQTSTIASHLPRAVGPGDRAARAPPARASLRVAATTRSWSARSATPRPTTPPPPGRSTPPSTRPTAGCRCRSVRLRGQRARHLGAARRPAGSRRRTAAGPGCATSRADGADPVERARPLIDRPSIARARHAPAGVPAPAHRPVPRPRRQRRRDRLPHARASIEADYARDPLLGHRAGAGRRGVAGRRGARPLRRRSRGRGRAEADRLSGRPRLRSARRGDGPAVAPATAAGQRAAAPACARLRAPTGRPAAAHPGRVDQRHPGRLLDADRGCWSSARTSASRAASTA